MSIKHRISYLKIFLLGTVVFFSTPNFAQASSSSQVSAPNPSKSLVVLDSLAANLNASNFSTYLELIKSSLKELSSDQAILYFSRALQSRHKSEKQMTAIHYQLAEEYFRKVVYDSSIYHVDQLLANFEWANPREAALALEVKAVSLSATERIAELHSLFSEYGEFLKTDFPSNYLYVYDNIIYNFLIASKYDEVIEEGRKAVDFARKTEDFRHVILFQNRIASAHKNNKNYEIARDYLQQNLVLLKSNPDQVSEIYVTYDLGLLYRDIDQLDSAIWYMSKSVSLMDARKRNVYLPQLATLYVDNKQFGEARKVLDSVNTSLLKEKTVRGEYLSALAMLNAGLENYFLATDLLDSALILRARDVRESARLKYALSEVYTKMGNDASALLEYKQADAIEDSLYSLEKQEAIANLESKFQLSEREKDIIQLEARAARNQGILIATIGLIVLVCFIAFLLYRLYLTQKNANLALADKNEDLRQLRIREKESSDLVIAAKESELASMAMSAYEKNNLLKNLEQKVSFIERDWTGEDKPNLKELKKTLSNSYSLDESWNSFLHNFEGVHPHFFTKLKEENPNLTNDDLKLSAYLKIGMNNKEIAAVIHIATGSVKTKVTRLKKKMNMPVEQNLREYMLKYA